MSELKQIRIAVGFVIFGLVVSGVTAFPLLHELNLLVALFGDGGDGGFMYWIHKVRDGLDATYRLYPFVAYGTDWLAFAHLMIALFFVLPWQDPRRYDGVLKVGVLVSLLVIPLALICGPLRGIPFWWRMIDCSFGLCSLPPLLFALRKIRALPA